MRQTCDTSAEVPLPPLRDLTQRQQRGMDCVFCGVVLVAGNAFDLGPRRLRIGDWTTKWFPRACKTHPHGRAVESDAPAP